jgi:hypothetical protein
MSRLRVCQRPDGACVPFNFAYVNPDALDPSVRYAGIGDHVFVVGFLPCIGPV